MADYYFKTKDGRVTNLQASTGKEAISRAQDIARKNSTELLGSPSTNKVAINKISPTVITDANIRESVIPSVNEKADSLLPDPTFSSVTIPTPGTRRKSSMQESTTDPTNSKENTDYASMMDTASLQDQNDPIYQQELKLLTSMGNNIDAQTRNYINSIRGKFDVRNRQLVESQRGQTKATQQALLLGGSARYAPVSSSGILSAKERYDMQTLADLQAEEDSLIMEAQTARDSKQMQLLQQKLGLLEEKRKEKIEFAKSLNDSMLEENKKLRERQAQADRDNTIVEVLSRGITNPAEVLRALNYDEGGNIVGDYSLEEVSKTLKSVAPGGNVEKLSADIRDFFILKENGTLPTAVSTLPEGDQMAAWINFMNPKKSSGSSGGGGKGSSNKITLSEADSRGLPRSVVGMSEEEVAESFYDPNPPQWFIEKVFNEKTSLLPSGGMQGLWDIYRMKFDEVEKKPASNSSSSREV